MSEGDSNLQKLLDGEFDAEQIASDPVLSSLAERIYGVTIEPITPTKASHSSNVCLCITRLFYLCPVIEEGLDALISKGV